MKFRSAINDAAASVRALVSPPDRTRAVLDLTGDEIFLVVPNGKQRVMSLGDSLEEAIERISPAVPRSTTVNCIIPARMVTVRRWPVPDASAATVGKIISARIAAQMPAVAADLSWTYNVVVTPNGPEATVYLVKKRYVEQIADGLEKARFVPGVFENEVSLLHGIVSAAGAGDALILRRAASVGFLVDVDKTGPKHLFAVADTGSSTDWIEELARRWRENSPGAKAGRVFVDSNAPEAIRRGVRETFSVEPRAFPLVGSAGLRDTCPLAAALLVLGRKGDLNPFSERLSFTGRLKNILAVHFGLLVAVTVLVLVACLGFDYAMAKIGTYKVASALKETKSASSRLDYIQQKTEMLGIMAKKKFDIPGLLLKIAEATQTGVRYEEISIRARHINLKGQGAAASVEKLLASLKSLAEIESAEVLTIRGNRFEVRGVLSAGAVRSYAAKTPASKPVKEAGK